ACQRFVISDCSDADAVEVQPRLRRAFLESRFRPRLKSFIAELCQSRALFLVSDAHLALGERSAVCRFHVACYHLVLLPGGFPYRLTVEGELVPVGRTAFVDRHTSASDFLLYRSFFL